MTSGSVEELIREAIGRLDRQEERTHRLESALESLRPTESPSPVSVSTDTPVNIPWVTREPGPTEPLDLVVQLRAQLAEAEEARRRAEDRLRQAQRMETLGRLGLGVAHDLNNLLTVIAGNADLIRDHLPTGDPLRDTADLIASTATTAAGVGRQLLALGRPVPGPAVPIDVSAAVRGVERLLDRLSGDGVDVVLLLGAAHPILMAPAQFDQVLLNLVINARDAIPDTGTITVRTADTTVSPDRPDWPADRPTGAYVTLTVADTGCGMTPDVLERMFDPFFTTKGEHGTGLGLSTVRELVRNAGGHIEVDSTPGWGTTVRVFWPRVEDVTRTPAPPSRPAAVAHGETVLLVQDSPPLRDVAALTLQHAGYRVLEAPDGETAEERARLYAGPIHLLVADVGLPRGCGGDLSMRLRATRPTLKVLLVSGSPPPELEGAAFLAKPFAPNELLEAVRQTLDR